MILYANGCSMTYGYELVDDPRTHLCLDDVYREAHAWPGRLGSRLGCDRVVNDAIPGGSNDRVLRTTIQWVLDHLDREGEEARDHLLVVIGWSDPMRREFFIDGAWKQTIPYHDYPEDPDLDKLNRVYRDLAWNEYESACRFLTQALAMQCFLNYHRIPFLFFDAIKSCQETLAAARDLLSHARALDPRTYLNMAQCNGSMASVLSEATPNWKGRHPAEDGHDHWAELLARHYQRHGLGRPAGEPCAASPDPSAARIGGAWRSLLGKLSPRRSAPRHDPFIYP
jgi:lysophospholipase L1-like esterase